jgi:hypothetical protein
MHKRNKIALLLLTPVESVQCEKELAKRKKNDHALIPSKTHNE